MKTYVVTGSDGSGKSTLCDSLYKTLKSMNKKVEVATIWDVLEKKLFIENVSKKDVGRYLKDLSPSSRSLFLMHCMDHSLSVAKRSNPDILIVNSYWYKYYVSEILHGADASWLDDIVKCFPDPDYVFYLEISPQNSLNRKDQISDYEGGHQEDLKNGYLNFQQKAQILWKKLILPSWMVLDAMKTKDQLLQISLDVICHNMEKRTGDLSS